MQHRESEVAQNERFVPVGVFGVITTVCAGVAVLAPIMVVLGGAIWVPLGEAATYAEWLGWPTLVFRYLQPIWFGLCAGAACIVLTISAKSLGLTKRVNSLLRVVAMLSWLWLVTSMIAAIVLSRL